MKCWYILRKLGNGEWRQNKKCALLKVKKTGDCKRLKLWLHKIGRLGRLIFEVCIDYNEHKDAHMDTIRIWVRLICGQPNVHFLVGCSPA